MGTEDVLWPERARSDYVATYAEAPAKADRVKEVLGRRLISLQLQSD